MTNQPGSSGPAWEAFAAREPYFAILSAPEFRRANLNDDHLREFFAGGERLAEWILRTIELRLVPRFSPVSILEYGCGVGRLAIPLAKRGGHVVAADRSPAMLDVARTEAARQGAAQIEFVRPEALAPARKFDLITSYLVFQRMPQAEGLAVLDALLSHLGPGGVGVFQFSTGSSASIPVRASRAIRRAPPLNALANLLLGKSVGEPYTPTYVYDLNAVIGVLRARGMDPTFVSSAPDGSTVVIAQAPVPAAFEGSDLRTSAAATDAVDVERLIANTSVEELNRLAETYFTSLKDWDHHLAKPFADIDETPSVLMDVAVLLRGLKLRPGATVLDFGSGTGWLSRLVTQLGCHAVLLDVSPTALTIARSLYERLPVIGERPAPDFLTFDGTRINMPDASADRIMSFHAFHHVPNPEAVLEEFARILKPGGIAAFVEPGPRHSESAVSQFEMRTYGVVERDIDVHAVWRAAARHGFAAIDLAVWHGPSFHVSLERFEDFLAGGSTGDQWLYATRDFLRQVRTFFLTKSGAERADSRSAAGLACAIRIDKDTTGTKDIKAGAPIIVTAVVTNTGSATWLASGSDQGGVWLGAHVRVRGEAAVRFDAARGALTRDIAPGETVTLQLTIPAQLPGEYQIELDCVAAGVNWFAKLGSQPATVDVVVKPT